MAGVLAVLNSKRIATGEPLVGFANPLLYSVGSQSNGTFYKDAINQIIAPTTPVALLRGYAVDLNEARVVTVNSVPFLHHQRAVRARGVRSAALSRHQ